MFPQCTHSYALYNADLAARGITAKVSMEGMTMKGQCLELKSAFQRFSKHSAAGSN